MKKKFMIVAAAAAIFGLLTFSGCETTDPDNGDKTEQTGENGNGDGSGSDENDGSGEDSGEQGGGEPVATTVQSRKARKSIIDFNVRQIRKLF